MKGPTFWSLFFLTIMRFYLFTQSNEITGSVAARIRNIVFSIGKGSNTIDLVTVLYLTKQSVRNRGTAYVQNWISPLQFHPNRGKWLFTQKLPLPKNLPDHYKLIRLLMEWNQSKYPITERDIYHWEFYYPSFEDHLANLFAHELHHFRRYHLGLHPKEGEQAANRWALKHVQNLGFQVKGKKLKVRIRKKHKNFLETVFHIDPFSDFRQLKTGQQIRIIQDSRKTYQNQMAMIVRPIRKNSKRMVIQTSDGKTWRWPINWLQLPDHTES